jgi:hypothetical protein
MTGTTAGRGRATASPRTHRRAAGGAGEVAAVEVAVEAAAGPGRVPPSADRPTPRPTPRSVRPEPGHPSETKTSRTPSSGVAKGDGREGAGAARPPGSESRHLPASVKMPSRTRRPPNRRPRTAPRPVHPGSAAAAAAAAARSPAKAPAPVRKRRRSPSAPGAHEPSRSRWRRAGRPAASDRARSAAAVDARGNHRSPRPGSPTS